MTCAAASIITGYLEQLPPGERSEAFALLVATMAKQLGLLHT